jgi:signal recognition particle receptor subunit beta
MAEPRPGVNARIVLWGAPGAGKSTSLRVLHERLRPDRRGALRRVPAPGNPGVAYELLPIELGELAGQPTRIEVLAAPGGEAHESLRRQLLHGVDGILFVVDSRLRCIDATLEAFHELCLGLAAYGRRLEDVPLVLQYNKRDLADASAHEAIHRKLDLPGVAAFESVALRGEGVLQALTALSKRVVRNLRGRPAGPGPAPGRAAGRPAAPPPDDPDDPRVAAAVERTRELFESAWPELRAQLERLAPAASPSSPPARWALGATGPARSARDGSLRLPLVLRDADGREARLVLSLRLEASPDDAS